MDNNSGKNPNNKNNEELFWADQLAKQVISRKKYRYLDKTIKQPKELVLKTAASLSGVLHIGRLSDTIRISTVHQAILDAGKKSRLIWVADDMDSLRKIPKNVPQEFEKYIGMPVTDIPDPDGNFKSYAERFKAEYFEVIDGFVAAKMEKFSMREEYRKGNFNNHIKKLMENAEEVRKIQNKYRTNKIPKGFSPWKPLCGNCGKIATTQVKEFSNGIVNYHCRDYEFETVIAKGCGHKGTNDPMKDPGKLAYKSESAAQWARWDVSCEGWGKEYQVPNSAFWINAEICENVLDFPAPEPFFYEHLMIDGEKMSASLGNVVYPKDWLEVAPVELLRFFYNKRLMKTRSFSWKDLPKLYDDYDTHASVYFGKTPVENKKEEQHMKRLFEISSGREKELVPITFSHASIIAQLLHSEAYAIERLEKTGHYNKKDHDVIFKRINYAKNWLERYAPEDAKFEVQDEIPKGLKLDGKEKEALHMLAKSLGKKEWNEKTLFEEFYTICGKAGIKNTDFFRAAYNVLLNKDRGPKLAPLILTIGREKASLLFEKA